MNNRINQPEARDRDRERLDSDLQELFKLPVPALSLETIRGLELARPVGLRASRRPAFIGAAAAAVVGALLVGSSLIGGGPSEVSAEQIFERTREVTASDPFGTELGSYHLVSRSEATGLNGWPTVTEVWFDSADRQRSETRDTVTGDLMTGSLKTGEDIWFYSEDGGEMTAVHNSLAGGNFSIAVGQGAQIGLGAGSLADLLDGFTSECSDATNLGDDVVAGRHVYVIEVVSTPETCDIKVIEAVDGESGVMIATGSVDADEAAPFAGGAAVFALSGPMRMWIDQETFMTLRSESSFQDLVFGYEVTSLDFDMDFSSEAGLFELPAGTRVVESGSTDAEGIGLPVFTIEMSEGEGGSGIPGIEIHAAP